MSLQKQETGVIYWGKVFCRYLSSIARQWFVIIGFIPWIYGCFSAYLPEPFCSFTFPKLLIHCYLVFAFLIASFKLWAKEMQEKEKLIKELKKLKKSPVDFNIHYEIKLVQSQVNKDRTEEELEFANKKIRDKRVNPLFLMGPTIEDWQSYKEQIGNYKKEVEEYNKKHEHFYNVHFWIENTGFVYDESIGVKAFLGAAAKFYPFIEPLPEFPQRPRSIFTSIQELTKLPAFSSSKGVSPYRTNIEIKERHFEVELRDLRVEERASILYDGVFIELLKPQDKLAVEFEIKSKKLKITLKKRVVIDF